MIPPHLWWSLDFLVSALTLLVLVKAWATWQMTP